MSERYTVRPYQASVTVTVPHVAMTALLHKLCLDAFQREIIKLGHAIATEARSQLRRTTRRPAPYKPMRFGPLTISDSVFIAQAISVVGA